MAALHMSALFSYVRAPLRTAPLPRADVRRAAGVKFKHIFTPGSPQLGERPATSHPPRGEKLPVPAAALRGASRVSGPPPTARGNAGWPVRVALGAALGAGAAAAAAAAQSLHTGTVNAMALKVNLNSAEGDWKETKDFLLSLSVKDRRQYYKTSNFVPLDDVKVWTSTAESAGSEKSHYPRNEKLDPKISLYTGDITQLEIDAIVNAANKTLLGGGGVDGAIHRAAGPLLKKECSSLRGCDTGEAKMSGGYGLPAKHVIHTVGPIAQGGVGEEQRKALRSCYRKSLETAAANAARSVAFPCISTGIYGYPPEQAVHEALATVRMFLDEHHDKLDRVIFCVFLPTDKELYLQNLPLYFPAAC